MMRVIANVFLLLFLVDGVISLLDGLASLILPCPPLAAARPVIAGIAIIMADLVYFLMSIDRRLPKRVFIPLILYVFMLPIMQWLMPSMAALPGFAPVAASGQILLLLLVTREFWQKDRRTITLPKSIFHGPAFSLKNTVVFAAVNIVVIPCVLALGVLTTTDAYLKEHTSGFMRLAPDGLHMFEKTYRRQDQTIRLAAMIHMGEKDYYDKVVGAVDPGRTIILAEGVTDNAQLLRNRPDYGKLAGYLGLASQQEKMRFPGRQIDEMEMAERGGAGKGEVDILRADVDVSSFRPTTVWFLNALGKQMQESRTLSQQLLGSIAWSEKNITPEMQQAIMDDVLHRRNEVLIGHLRKAIARYDNIVIPWGALHMAEVQREVLKQGFQLQQVQDRVSIRFGKHGKGAVTTSGQESIRRR